MSTGSATAGTPASIDEFNPFQAMAQRFEVAADHLGLDKGLREVLRTGGDGRDMRHAQDLVALREGVERAMEHARTASSDGVLEYHDADSTNQTFRWYRIRLD